ncbi:Smg-6, nonsense mediated mRNA decay factor [Clydaea vesicula]|uniref:Smg-6, nonsense mediated mRNA decay factor n=1 Tax=Clydaea vesicula TaxID=447962 RepID=A0AAD5XVH7_9FUNG|nr:Smg-6, nonsense mediated mRNA decay factor [Clydaea vesicula]
MEEEKLAQLKILLKTILKLEGELKICQPSKKKIENSLIFQKICVQFIELNYAFTVKYEIEKKIWKIGVYNVINDLKLSQSGNFKESVREDCENWNNFLDSSLKNFICVKNSLKKAYYAEIIKKISDKFNLSKVTKLIPYWHKISCNLGDIYRYKAQYVAAEKINWENAYLQYKEASFLTPNNGFYYSLLGSVSTQLNKPLLALYYYMRCFTVRSPYNPGDALTMLFRYLQDDNNDSTDIIFFTVIEILFSKIGLDNFNAKVLQFATNFDAKLKNASKHEKVDLSFLKLYTKISCAMLHFYFIKLTDNTINRYNLDIFIENTLSLILKILLVLVDFIFKYVNFEDLKYLEKVTDPMISIWIVISKNNEIWNSLIALSNALINYTEDGWMDEFYKSKLKTPDYLVSCHILLEDWDLNGFETLKEAINPATFLKLNQVNEKEFDELLDYVISGQDVNEDWNDRVLSSCLVFARDESFFSFNGNKFQRESNNDEVVITECENLLEGNVSDEEYEEIDFTSNNVANHDMLENDVDEEMKNLVLQKRKLNQRINEEQKNIDIQKQQSLKIRKLVKFKSTIIFDTNCYLHNFDKIRIIIEKQFFFIILPLVVLTELEGISKNPSSEEVNTNSKASLQFIEEFFKTNMNVKNKSLKIITSKGNFLNNLNMKIENFGNDFGSADDVVLRSCLSLEKENDVFLCTQDVNFRLKARANGVACISMKDISI